MDQKRCYHGDTKTICFDVNGQSTTVITSLSEVNRDNIEMLFAEIEKLQKQNADLLRRIEILEEHDPVKIIRY